MAQWPLPGRQAKRVNECTAVPSRRPKRSASAEKAGLQARAARPGRPIFANRLQTSVEVLRHVPGVARGPSGSVYLGSRVGNLHELSDRTLEYNSATRQMTRLHLLDPLKNGKKFCSKCVIEFHGCLVGADPNGKIFLQNVANWSGCTVKASKDFCSFTQTIDNAKLNVTIQPQVRIAP